MKLLTNKLLLKLFSVLLIVLFLGTAGCASEKESLKDESGQPPAQSRVVIDSLGREVEIPAEVHRIATLYAYTGHVAVMLGRGQDIVAINDGLRRDVLLNLVCPGVGDNPVPFTKDNINIEELITTDPDVVFLKNDVASNTAEVEKLEKFGIPYVAVDFNNIEEQMRSIELMGEVLGCQEQANAFNRYYQECIDRVESRVKDIPEGERVRVYHSINEASRTDAPGTLPADWLEKCGVINVSVSQKLRLLDGKYYASLEQILLWDADVIIANEAGVPEYIMSNPQWAPLKAVKNQRVYQMPVGISRWGHPGGLETPLAILWTAKTVYPEYFTDLDLEAEARDYYGKFFNYKVSDEMLQRILKAEDMRQLKNQQLQNS